MSEAETSNIEFENLIASATHQQLLFNSVYFQLWHLNTVLKAKYDTLQKNYSTLATSIPHVFSIIPNPYSVAVPASAPSTTAQFLLPSTKPDKIKYWRRSDYNVRKTTRGDLTVLNDASGSDSDEEMPRKKKKAKTDNVLGFLEHADGKPFDETTISFVRSTSYKIFQSLLDASLAPANWRDCSLEATNRFRAQMIQAIPDLALGENYWKVDLVGTEVYAQWKRKHLPAGNNVKDDNDDDNSLNEWPTLKKQKTKVQVRKVVKGKEKEGVLEKRKRVNHSGHKHRRIEDSIDGTQLDTQIISDNTCSLSPPPVEMPAQEPNNAVLPPPPSVEMLTQESNESLLPSPPSTDTPMPHFTESTPATEREEMVQMKNPLSEFYVEAPPTPPLPSTRIIAVASTFDSASKSTLTANAVASTSKCTSSKPKGATYFIPTATFTGYNLFGKSFTDDGKKKIPREQVKAEYQKPENKQTSDSDSLSVDLTHDPDPTPASTHVTSGMPSGARHEARQLAARYDGGRGGRCISFDTSHPSILLRPPIGVHICIPVSRSAALTPVLALFYTEICGTTLTRRTDMLPAEPEALRQRFIPLLLLFVCVPFRYPGIHARVAAPLLSAAVLAGAGTGASCALGELLCAPLRACSRVHADLSTLPVDTVSATGWLTTQKYCVSSLQYIIAVSSLHEYLKIAAPSARTVADTLAAEPEALRQHMPLLLLFVCAPFRYPALTSPHHYSGPLLPGIIAGAGADDRDAEQWDTQRAGTWRQTWRRTWRRMWRRTWRWARAIALRA
ncbi:hypothetical protein GGX14DRAFT_600955 [Mycena pura]|uniref:Uncharacterized protein n=1 Tax=Mycena pura TaxID=153505 RepID=A0AAD6UN58_9AGAR|nr:hypothetical protein GGX14DRAFT_600955 [Mycena pura]